MSIIDKSGFEITDMIKKGELKAVDVAKAFLDRAEALEAKIGAFNYLNRDSIIQRAEGVDAKRARGETLGGLAGVPVIVKDNMLSQGEPTTCSSKIMEGYISVFDATVVARLKNADALTFGKSNLDEFAMGSSTENSAFKLSRNPWDLDRVPGGSSGGSSAAVAADVAPIALGSDTGGSIRQPAAFCGIYGLKPTYGRVSRYGLVSFGSSLDQIGPFARYTADIATSMNAMAGFDRNDSTSAKEGVPDYTSFLNKDISSFTIGVLEDDSLVNVDPEIASEMERSIEIFKSLGAKIEKIKVPSISHSIEAYYVIAPAEVSSNLSRFDGIKYGLAPKNPENIEDIYFQSRTEGFGDEVKRRVMIGNFVLSAGHYNAYHRKAYQVRQVLKDEFDQAFAKVDVVLLPTTPTTAFKFGENVKDPVKMYLSDIFTACANLAGIPGISIPTGAPEGLPVGLQLLGKQFGEGDLIALSSAFEKANKFTGKPRIGE